MNLGQPYIFSINVNDKWKILFRTEEARAKFLRFMREKKVPAMMAMMNSGEAMKVASDKDDATKLSGKHQTIIGRN